MQLRRRRDGSIEPTANAWAILPELLPALGPHAEGIIGPFARRAQVPTASRASAVGCRAFRLPTPDCRLPRLRTCRLASGRGCQHYVGPATRAAPSVRSPPTRFALVP